jgi:nicotinamidase-related amidase
MNKILVVVDMQNDFVTGSLGTKEAQAIVPAVVRKINERKKEGYAVYMTCDTHTSDYLSTAEGKALPVEHCIKGTRGWEVVPKVAEAAGKCPVFYKQTFASAELFLALQKSKADVVEFVGLCSDICVVSNILGAKAFLPDAQFVADSNCCAGATPEGHEAAFKVMRSCLIQII